MPPLLRSANLVISTCQYEPSGTTSLQAMACGTRHRFPGRAHIGDVVVDGATGIVVPAGPARPCWRSVSASCSPPDADQGVTAWRRLTGFGRGTPGTASRGKLSRFTTA